jgi:hypothetical protein
MVRQLLSIMLLAAGAAMAQEEEVTLKPGPGQDETTISCFTCHTLNYIRMNSMFLTQEAWKAEVTKMREAFGASIDEDTANAIVKYLTATYGVPPKS